MTQRVDHDIADEMDAPAGTAFFKKVSDGVFFSNEQIVSYSVGENAIDFFRHGAIETAQPGFHMGDGDAQLGSGERNGYGRIDISNDQYEIGPEVGKDWLNAAQNFGGLRGVGARADLQID